MKSKKMNLRVSCLLIPFCMAFTLICGFPVEAQTPQPGQPLLPSPGYNPWGGYPQRPDVSTCAGMENSFSENWQRMRTYCSSTGTSSSACSERIRTCQEDINNLVSKSSEITSATSPSSLTGVATSALGALVGPGYGDMISSLNDPSSELRDLAKGCPRLTGRDYQQRKRDSMRDLKDAEKDLADEDKKIKDAQKELNKESTRIQKDLASAQTKFEEKKLEVEEEAREGLRKILEDQRKIQSEIRSKNTEALSKRQQLVQEMRKHSVEMVSYTEATFKRICMSRVRELRDKLYKDTNKGKTSGRYLSEGASQSKDLKAVYSECMKEQDERAADKLETIRSVQQQIENSIDNIEDDLTALNENLASLSQRTKELESNKETKISTAQKDLINTVQTLQKELTDLQNATTNELRLISSRKQAIQNRINVARVEIAALGPEPSDSGSGSGPNSGGISYADAASALGTAELISSQYQNRCSENCTGASASSNPICALSRSGSPSAPGPQPARGRQ